MGLVQLLPSGCERGTLLRVCVTPLKADAHHGEKTRIRAGFSAQHRGKQDSQKGTGVGGFSWGRSAL